MSAAHILISERDGHVALLQRDPSGAWSRTVIALHGRWPSLSPDGSRSLHSTIVPTGDTGQSIIAAVPLAGGENTIIHAGTPGVLAFIAPSVPHYSLWAPTSDAVSYVTATEQGLALFVTTLDGALHSHRVAIGAPMFHSWSPDGSRIVLHAGTDVAVFDRATLTLTELAQGSHGFRVPRFRPDGASVLYALPAGEEVSLVLHEMNGGARALCQFVGGLAFAWAGRDRVLVGVSRKGDGSSFEELWLVDAETGHRQPVAPGTFSAFWCDPAGDRVALLVPAHSGDARMSLHVRDLNGRVLAVSEPLLLSDDARIAITFFDQYELSHPAWAPDGSALALCGRLGDDAISGSWGDPIGDFVLLWRATRGAAFDRIAPGVCASFAPPSTSPQ